MPDDDEIVLVNETNRDLLRLPSCLAIHGQLRPILIKRFSSAPQEYAEFIEQVCRSGHSHLCLVLRRQASDVIVLALALYRHHLNTFNTVKFDILDLIVDEKERNHGLGTRLFQYLLDQAKQYGGTRSIVLQCDLTNTDAHRFFFRQELTISSFGFRVDHLELLNNSSQIQILDITDDENEYWLTRAHPIHRQLRPHLPADRQTYIDQIRTICRTGPARILLAIENDDVLGLTIYRIFDNIKHFKHFYCDDLVTDETKRSRGVGRCLINALKLKAKELNADCLTLDSGVQRQQAHKFYYREGFVIDQFEFALVF